MSFELYGKKFRYEIEKKTVKNQRDWPRLRGVLEPTTSEERVMLNSILPSTLLQLLKTKAYSSQNNHKIVIYDMRYKGEYDLGHIRDAKHGTSKLNFDNHPKYDKVFSEISNKPATDFSEEEDSIRLFEVFGKGINATVTKNIIQDMRNETSSNPNGKIVFIFHCEYSSHRAPGFMNQVNKAISAGHSIGGRGKANYSIFLLQGGYKMFYKHIIESINKSPKDITFYLGNHSPLAKMTSKQLFSFSKTNKPNKSPYQGNLEDIKRVMNKLLFVYYSPDKNKTTQYITINRINVENNSIIQLKLENPNEIYFKISNRYYWIKDFPNADTICFPKAFSKARSRIQHLTNPRRMNLFGLPQKTTTTTTTTSSTTNTKKSGGFRRSLFGSLQQPPPNKFNISTSSSSSSSSSSGGEGMAAFDTSKRKLLSPAESDRTHSRQRFHSPTKTNNSLSFDSSDDEGIFSLSNDPGVSPIFSAQKSLLDFTVKTPNNNNNNIDSFSNESNSSLSFGQRSMSDDSIVFGNINNNNRQSIRDREQTPFPKSNQKSPGINIFGDDLDPFVDNNNNNPKPRKLDF